MNIKVHIEKYFLEAIKNKIRLVLGAAVFIVLSFFSYKCLRGDISSKKVLISFVLIAGSALTVAFPMPFEKYLSIPISILYLVFVPAKLFVRIEYPVHDMSRIQDGAEFVTILIILLIYMIFLLVFQRLNWALGIGGIFILIASLINFYLNAFRGSSLSFNDLLATGTAMSVIDNYRLFMTKELWYTILYFVFFICFGFWCRMPYKGLKYHAVVSTVAICYGLIFFLFWSRTDFLEEHGLHGHYWNMAENEALNGFLLSFLISMEESAMDIPEGYSEARLEEIKNSLQTSQNLTEEYTQPNIIFIMNEAWSDLRILGNIETTEDFMPFVDGLTENTTKGNLHVGILGGLTANSEFEALTGDSLAFLSTSAIPYQLQINHSVSSVATILKEQGYQTMAMHPSTANAWNRGDAYGYMGFDAFVDINAFQTEYEYVRSFISDNCNFNEIIYQYEHRDKEKPFFLFNVTIQNHGDYYGGFDLPIELIKVGEKNVEDAGYTYDLQTYLNLMSLTDQAFERLVTYFSEVEEPTIICMFGDHQPVLNENFYQLMAGTESAQEIDSMKKYMTPYVIWSNYDSEFKEYGDLSANYLGAVLLECAGVKIPAYYDFLLELHTEYPVLSHIGCLDAEGNRYTIDELMDLEKIVDYRMLQYNHLLERNWKRELFGVPEDKKWYDMYSTICHAMGMTKEGDTLTNSLEAFEYNYELGQRVFEVDLSITSDNVVVLRHDWNSDLGQAEEFGWTEDKKEVPDLNTFKNTLIYDKYTPITLLELFEKMEQYKDMYVVLDAKYNSDVKMQYELIVNTAMDNGYENVLERVIPQIYYEEMYAEIEKVYSFKEYIYTLYYIGYSGGTEEAEFCKENNINILVMPYTWFGNSVYKKVEGYPLKVYVHTVNDEAVAEEMLLDGASGIYTDCLLP